MKEIPKKFFYSNPKIVARDILGKLIFSEKTRKGVVITETEAYLEEKDLASHARFGKTKRNRPMYMDGGIWYVYMIYGIHFMLNVVVGKKDNPGAVLIRGGVGYKLDNNNFVKDKGIGGPGVLARFLGVDMRYNGRKINKDSGLYIMDVGLSAPRRQIVRSKRIGVGYAGEWGEKELRFILENIKLPETIKK